MFRKLKSFGASKRAKYRLDVTVGEVEGLPDEVGQCRVVWARQAKVSVTKTVAVSKGEIVRLLVHLPPQLPRLRPTLLVVLASCTPKRPNCTAFRQGHIQ